MTQTIPLHPFAPDWSAPTPRFQRAEIPPPPPLPLTKVLGSHWAKWVSHAAEAKSAPPDYVLAALLVTIGAAIGNTRWAMPWSGWMEPPILWAMVIGNPSSNKSPALDAVLTPLRQVEREIRRDSAAKHAAWAETADIASIAETTWKEAVKRALKEGETPPDRPTEASASRRDWP